MKPKIELQDKFCVVRENFEKLKKLGFGKLDDNVLVLDFYETYYLVKRNMVQSPMDKEELLKIFIKKDKKFLEKYSVYEYFKNRGYIVKSGLKYGTEFRLYEVSEDEHSKYLVKILFEDQVLDAKSLIALGRVAHSTRKTLLLVIVSKENDFVVYELKWFGAK